MVFDADKTPQAALVEFLKRISRAYAADFGMLHVVTQRDMDNWAELKKAVPLILIPLPRARKKWNVSLASQTLQKFVPDVFWANVFGPPYVALLGRNLLESAPAAQFEWLADDSAYLQTTPDLFDSLRDPDSVENAQRAIKQHLDHNIFFDPTRSASAEYTVPSFGHVEVGRTKDQPPTVRFVPAAATRPPRKITADHANEDPEQLHEASANFDIDDVPDILTRVSKLVERGYSGAEIERVMQTIGEMIIDDEIELRFPIRYKGRDETLWLTIFLDDSRSQELFFRGGAELAEAITEQIRDLYDDVT